MALVIEFDIATASKHEPYPGVIGADDRAALTEPEPFWNAVGKIAIAGFSWTSDCTGVLVAPDRVVTAAHCLVDHRMKKHVAARRVHFAAGVSRDTVAGRSVARCAAFLAGAPPMIDRPTASDWARDVVVLALETPLDIAPIQLSDDAAAAGALAIHAGYGRDRRYLLSIHRGCRIVGRADTLHFTDCDTNFGQSGGPVLIDDGGTAKLAGIMVGMSASGNIMLGVEAWRELINAPECASP